MRSTLQFSRTAFFAGLLFSMLVASLLFSSCRVESTPAPRDPALRRLQAPDLVEIYALDPVRIDRTAPGAPKPAARDVFHEFGIRGRARLDDPALRTQLAALLQRGFDLNDDTAAHCFDPRHGIHVESGGQVIDLLVCFECMQTEIHESTAGAPSRRVELIDPSVEPAVTRLYQSLGLTIAR